MNVADEISPELLAAHEAVRQALLQVQAAVHGCAGCAAREYRIVADQLEEMIEEAEAVADGAEHRAIDRCVGRLVYLPRKDTGAAETVGGRSAVAAVVRNARLASTGAPAIGT